MSENGKGPKDFEGRPIMRVEFEDGHLEDFHANHILVTNAGGLMLSFNEQKPVRQLTAQGWQEGFEVTAELRAAIAAPRPDLPRGANWLRVTALREGIAEPDTLPPALLPAEEAN